MFRSLLAGLFVLTFGVTLIANLPAKWVMQQFQQGASGLSYERATGTIWNGRLAEVMVAGQPLGEVQFQFRPLRLVQARATYDVAVRGDVGAFQGEVWASPGGGFSARLPRARIHVQELARVDPLLRRAPSHVDVAGLAIRLNRDRACTDALGDLSTDILSSLGPRFGWNGPALNGSILCREGKLVIALQSVEGADDISAKLLYDGASGQYELLASVETHEQRVVGAMRRIGFEQVNGAWTYHRSSRVSVAHAKPDGTDGDG